MGIMRSRHRTGWFLAVIGALALMGACSLNTQPIPPGYNGTDETSDAAPTNAVDGKGDGGGTGGGVDSGTVPPEDDAGSDDAGDASIEDASDSGDQ